MDLRIKIRLNKNKVLIGIIFITFILVLWAPTTSGSTIGSDVLKYVTRMLYFVLAIVILLMTKWKKKRTFLDWCIALTPLVNYLVHVIWSYDGRRGSVSTALLCLLFALQNDEVKKSVYKCIKWFLIINAIVGIICYISYFLNIGLPYDILPYYSQRRGQWYIDYHICYLYRDGLQVRLCGLFNEPGWLGTFLAFYLCAEDLNFKKISNVIIGIAGVLTFSLAYILILVIYFILKNITNWKRCILVVLFAFLYIYALPNIETGNDYVDELISRMVITEEGVLGDNRTSIAFDNVYDSFIKSQDVFLGKGYGYSLSIIGGSNCSIKTDIVDFGIIGTVLLYAPLLSLLVYKSKRNKNAIVFLACAAISLYQRPWLFEVSNFMLVLGAVAYLTAKNSEDDSAMNSVQAI